MNSEVLKPINVHDSGKGMFNTRSGLLVDILNPTAEMICSEDIAHALSRICRFGGHTMGHWSVAQHSILVAALAPAELKLEALLHDASEAYLGDVIKPLKNLLGFIYGNLEKNFETVIATKYNLSAENLRKIKRFDKEALELEHEAFIKDSLNAVSVTQNIIVHEVGREFPPHETAVIFMELIKRYTDTPCMI